MPARKPLSRGRVYLHFWLYWIVAWSLIGISGWLIAPFFSLGEHALATFCRVAIALSLTVWSWCAWVLAGRKVTCRKKDSKPSPPVYAQWSTKSLYTARAIGLGSAAVGLLGLALEVLAASLGTDLPAKTTNTPDYSFVLVFFGLLLANGTWKEMLRRDPGASRGKRQGRVRAGLAVSICAVLLAVCGAYLGRNAPVKALHRRMAELRPANDRFKMELSRIRSADLRTFEDYHKNCLKLEALLDSGEPLRREVSALFAEFGRMARDRPDAQPVAAFVRSIGETDDRIFSLLRDEIAHAKKLVDQPPNKQEAYHKEHIQPIQAEIARLAEQEVQLLRRAQQQGIELPADVAEMLR